MLTDITNGLAPDGRHTVEGRLIVYKGDVISDDLGLNYTILDKLGSGNFADVYLAKDDRYNQQYACKIVKLDCDEDYGAIEVNLNLKLQNLLTDEEKMNIIQMEGCFTYEGHVVIIYELLGQDMYSILLKNNYRPMNLKMTRLIFKDIAKACQALHKNKLIHADIKPENISHIKNTTISKLIDIGGIVEEEETRSGYFITRYYRAPEVVLGYPITTAADIWSLACTMAELALGLPLFYAMNENFMLRRMSRIVGEFPQEMIQNAPLKDKFFENGAIIDEATWCAINNRPLHKAGCTYPGVKSLDDFIVQEDPNSVLFWDLLKKMFVYDPKKRITAQEILQHPFITGSDQ